MARRSHGPGAACLSLALGTGCLSINPGFDETTGQGVTATTEAPTTAPPTTGTTGTTAETTAETGTASASGTGTTTPLVVTSTGDSTTGDPTTGMSSADTGETSSGDTTTGGPAFCDAPKQAELQCQPLADTPFLVCDQAFDWTAARDACTAVCGQLAVLATEDERVQVFAALEARMTPEDEAEEPTIPLGDQQNFPRASYWVGAAAPAKDIEFVWVDGTPLPSMLGVAGWATDDPDWSGLCVGMPVWGKQDNDGRWYDRTCTFQYRFVCEPLT